MGSDDRLLLGEDDEFDEPIFAFSLYTNSQASNELDA